MHYGLALDLPAVKVQYILLAGIDPIGSSGKRGNRKEYDSIFQENYLILKIQTNLCLPNLASFNNYKVRFGSNVWNFQLVFVAS
jgi:hypothetical protein